MGENRICSGSDFQKVQIKGTDQDSVSASLLSWRKVNNQEVLPLGLFRGSGPETDPCLILMA